MSRGDRAHARPLLGSLRDFLRAGFRPRTRLQRTIVAALCIKLLVIVAMRAVSLHELRAVTTDQAVIHLIGIEPR